jgi:RNA polymerase sigma factor (sigma-70 family)
MTSAHRPEILDTFLHVRTRLSAVIYRRVRCSATTADLVQDTFLRFWERRSLLREVADLAGYFMTTGRNLALDHQRRKRIAPFVDGIDGLEAVADPLPSAEQVAISMNELRRISAIIDDMPPRAKQVFLMSRIDGLTYQEIGNHLGISSKTVFSHMVVALEHLRRQMASDD